MASQNHTLFAVIAATTLNAAIVFAQPPQGGQPQSELVRQGQQLARQGKFEEALAQYQRTILQAFREASDALVAVRTARDQRVAQQSQVVALRKASELANIRYRGGVASYLEVLDAERQLFSAELGLSQTQLLELSSVVGLYRALGGSWEVEAKD